MTAPASALTPAAPPVIPASTHPATHLAGQPSIAALEGSATSWEEGRDSAHLAPGGRGRIPDAERRRFEGNLAEILSALGLRLDTDGTSQTPRRFLDALLDATDGYDGDPKLLTSFPTECHGGANCELAQIVEGPIAFFALCEHHALPFFGRAWLGYVAHEEILGISKLTRLVRVLTRRFGVQERMTHQIADSLASVTHAHGVAVYLEAEHLCTQIRGVREHDALTRTSAYRGTYERDASLRTEFRDMAGIGRDRR